MTTKSSAMILYPLSSTILAAFAAVIALSVVGCGGDGGPTDNAGPYDIVSDQSGPDMNEPDAAVTDQTERDISADQSATDSSAELTGTDAEDSGMPDTGAIACQPEPEAPFIKVTVYNDLDSSSKTSFAQAIKDGDTPRRGVPVNLLAPTSGTGVTCDQGWYAFLPTGTATFTDAFMVMSIDAPDCVVTSHNLARKTPEALSAGKLKMVLMGDSIARWGGPKFFYDYLHEYLDGFGDITITNHAVAGSTSEHWMPGTNYFDNYIVPELGDTDVVFITLGGNDIMDYVYEHQSSDIGSLMEGIQTTISTVESNLETIFASLREKAPEADIVWLIYPNYADSEKWRAATGTWAEAVASFFQDEMFKLQKWAGGLDGIVLVDLFSRMNKADLDLSLYDQLHYNDYGHRILSEEIFKVLNGVILVDGTPTTGGDRMIGLHCGE